MVSDALSRFLIPGTDPDIMAAYDALAKAACERTFGLDEAEIVYLDIETTGFDRERDAIIEIAAIRAKGPKEVGRFSTLVDPKRPIPHETTRLTGIDDEMVAGASSIDEAIRELVDFVGQCDMVAHNCAFDSSFLSRACRQASVTLSGDWLCSLQLSRIALPRMRSHRLQDLALAFGLRSADHRALADTEAVFGLWRIALCGLEALPPEVVTGISVLAREKEWPLRKVIAHVAASRPSTSADVRELRKSRTKGRRSEDLADAASVELRPVSPERVACEFEESGAVYRIYPDYESRSEQLEMTEAVRDALCEGRHLAVEAGTGVGKSMAYLVPAIRFALENGVGVGIATKTNALTDQLVYGELPALSSALSETFHYVALKGYDHYLCLRKLDRSLSLLEEDGSQKSLVDVAQLLAWTAQTSWGDLDGINLHWRPENRARFVANAVDCTKRRCRYYPWLCYLHGLRRRAGTAHVLVTNHSLLFRDLMSGGGILPPIRHWIVDEAHGAEGEARNQLSAGADHRYTRTVLRGLSAKKGSAVLGVESRLGEIDDGELREEAYDLTARIREEASTCGNILESFFDELKAMGTEGSEYDRREMRITHAIRESAEWSLAAGIGRSLVRHLATLVGYGTRLFTLLEEAGLEMTDDRADLAGQLGQLQSSAEGVATVIEGEDDSYVYSMSVDRRPDSVSDSIVARTLDVGAVLAERFFPETRTTVFTSATIAAGEDFGHFARGVGLDRVEPGTWDSLRLDSSYDFERQMKAFIPNDLPQPGSANYLEALGSFLFDLHVAMGGSVLTLFTNRRDLDRLYRTLAEPLEAKGLRLVAQRTGSVKRVRDEFLVDESTSLLATKSFWEGFDAKGDTLRCVAVVRLPFAHPGDPVLEELKERDPAGWWSRHYLPRAILELKQAAGRLIRSKSDEGCLVICDTRIVGPKAYGRDFLDALPVRDVMVAPSKEVVERIRGRFGR